MILTQTLDRPTVASLTGSFMRPANTPFVTTVANPMIFVKMAGMAIYKKHKNILLVVGGSHYGSNILASSYSTVNSVIEFSSNRDSFLSFNNSVSLTSF